MVAIKAFYPARRPAAGVLGVRGEAPADGNAQRKERSFPDDAANDSTRRRLWSSAGMRK